MAADVPAGAPAPAEYRRKFTHKAEAVKGSVKQAAGSLTGSRRLRAEGRAGRFKGNLKQTGAKVKDAVKH